MADDAQYQVPTDFKSGLADLLSEAKNIYEAKKAQGFPTYSGPRIAGFSPEELAAMTGIAGLVGAGGEYFRPAAQLTMGQTERFTPTTAAQYMSPYQQAVVDVEKREAIRQAQRPRQDIAAAAAGAGSFGGSRQAILEAEQQRNLQQRLGDIQTRGSQAAYESGLRAFEAQKARERSAASGLASLGQVAPRQALAELTALSGVGEAARGLSQQGLDLAYSEFQKQQEYPFNLLSQYQSTLYGYPYQSFSRYQPTPRPSSSQNLAAVLGAVGKIAGPSGFGFFNTGGRVAYRSKGGLAGMVNKLQTGGQVGPDPFDRPPVQEEVELVEEVGANPATSARNALMEALVKSASGLTEYTTATKEAMAEKERLAQEQRARLQREESPVNYISDLLLGYAGADPDAGMAGQVAEAAKYASANRERVQDEILQIEQQLAEGKLSQAEAALKIRQAQTELLSDVYDVSRGEDVEASDINALARLAANKYDVLVDPETGMISGTVEQKQLVAELLEEMLAAYKRGGYSAAVAVASRGPTVSTGSRPSDTEVAIAADSGADAASKQINRIQNLPK